MALPLTYLFVPGNRPDRFDKALGSGADAVILDLEDAVDPAAKDEETGQVARAAGVLAPGGVVVPLIETARGLRAVDAIAAAERVQRLAFGTLDFAVDLDLSDDERGLIPAAMMIALASRCAGRAPPIAGV